MTYGLLVARADDEDIAITAQLGQTVYILTWLSFALSVAASLLWVVRGRRATTATKRPTGTIVEKLPRGYKMINQLQDECQGDSEDDARLIRRFQEKESKGESLNEDPRYKHFRCTAA